MLRLNRDILGVKPALWIDELVSPDSIANLKAARPFSFSRNDSSAIRPENDWKFRTSFRPPAPTDVRVPNADTRRMQRDEHFARSGLWNRKRTEFENRRRTEPVDRRRLHFVLITVGGSHDLGIVLSSRKR